MHCDDDAERTVRSLVKKYTDALDAWTAIYIRPRDRMTAEGQRLEREARQAAAELERHAPGILDHLHNYARPEPGRGWGI
ncbi:MAG: hypothetical protein ABJB98_08535 [Actinomycetota bacterium]